MKENKTALYSYFSIYDTIPLIFLCIGIFFLIHNKPFNVERSAFAITWSSILLEAFCFMAIGSLVSGVVEEFLPVTIMEKLLKYSKYAIIAGAAAMGFIFPVCECAVIPVVRRLIKKGLPLSAGIAFLLAGPIVNPVVIWSTFVAYRGDWYVILIRVIFGFCIACLAGIIAALTFKPKDALSINVDNADSSGNCSHSHCSHHSPKISLLSRIERVIMHAREDFLSVAIYLFIGTFIASFIRSAIPLAIFQKFTQFPVVSVGSMMGLAFVLNLCSEADAFVAASFIGIVPLLGQLAFMILGPMLDIKLLLMYKTLFKTRFIAFLSSLIVALVFTFMMILLFLTNRGAG